MPLTHADDALIAATMEERLGKEEVERKLRMDWGANLEHSVRDADDVFGIIDERRHRHDDNGAALYEFR